jgi:hypothetical protein
MVLRSRLAATGSSAGPAIGPSGAGVGSGAMPPLSRISARSATAWLEKGCNDRDVWALNLKVDPIYADLRTDARFVALLKRVGLEQ